MTTIAADTNPTSRARYTFGLLMNQLGSREKAVTSYGDELVTLLDNPSMNPLVSLELFAQWEQAKATVDQPVVRQLARLDKALTNSCKAYLSRMGSNPLPA